MLGRLCAFTLFICISSAFATKTDEDKPLKEKATQKAKVSQAINSTSSNNADACQPRNCIPITITKSKVSANAAGVFSSFLAEGTMTESVTPNPNHIIYEYGLRFSVTQPGKITKVGLRLPKAGTYRITIWDVAIKRTIIQQYMPQITDNVQSWSNFLAGLPLIPNKEYFISIISDNWNDAYPKIGTTVNYPIVRGSVKILAFAYASQPTLTAAPRYPDMEDNTESISGFVDFGFTEN